MSVAPSFQKYPTFGEPYTKDNGKMYIVIVYPDGHHREVRWYEASNSAPKEPGMKKIRPTKEVLGFKNGYITIFKGDTFPFKEWFETSSARYHKLFGWYFTSEDELPQIPAGLEPKQLKWEDVAYVDEDELRSNSVIEEAIAALVYENSESQFQGKIGDRLDLTLLVTKAIELKDGYYGPSTMYIMSDADGNVYIWTTAARKLEEGENYSLRGTVKVHQRFRGVAQTVLTRCIIQ